MAKTDTPAEKAPTSLKSLSTIEEGIKRGEAFSVDPNLIHFEEGFNLRAPGKETDAHIDRLYKAMKAGAVVPAVDVQIVEGKIIARDGHCRTTAAIKLRAENPDFVIQVRQLRGNDTDAVLHMLGTGNGQKPLTPLEQGKGFLRLINMGLKSKEIAERLGVSRPTIDNGIILAEAPRKLQDAILAGKVSSTMAREAIKAGKEGVAAVLAEVDELPEDEAPAPAAEGTKPAKKKPAAKVTAKKLKNTAAEKKPKKKKTTEPEAPAPEEKPQEETDPNTISIVISRDVAKEVADYLRANAPADSTVLLKFASDVEMSLM